MSISERAENGFYTPEEGALTAIGSGLQSAPDTVGAFVNEGMLRDADYIASLNMNDKLDLGRQLAKLCFDLQKTVPWEAMSVLNKILEAPDDQIGHRINPKTGQEDILIRFLRLTDTQALRDMFKDGNTSPATFRAHLYAEITRAANDTDQRVFDAFHTYLATRKEDLNEKSDGEGDRMIAEILNPYMRRIGVEDTQLISIEDPKPFTPQPTPQTTASEIKVTRDESEPAEMAVTEKLQQPGPEQQAVQEKGEAIALAALMEQTNGDLAKCLNVLWMTHDSPVKAQGVFRQMVEQVRVSDKVATHTVRAAEVVGHMLGINTWEQVATHVKKYETMIRRVEVINNVFTAPEPGQSYGINKLVSDVILNREDLRNAENPFLGAQEITKQIYRAFTTFKNNHKVLEEYGLELAGTYAQYDAFVEFLHHAAEHLGRSSQYSSSVESVEQAIMKLVPEILFIQPDAQPSLMEALQPVELVSEEVAKPSSETELNIVPLETEVVVDAVPELDIPALPPKKARLGITPEDSPQTWMVRHLNSKTVNQLVQNDDLLGFAKIIAANYDKAMTHDDLSRILGVIRGEIVPAESPSSAVEVAGTFSQETYLNNKMSYFTKVLQDYVLLMVQEKGRTVNQATKEFSILMERTQWAFAFYPSNQQKRLVRKGKVEQARQVLDLETLQFLEDISVYLEEYYAAEKESLVSGDPSYTEASPLQPVLDMLELLVSYQEHESELFEWASAVSQNLAAAQTKKARLESKLKALREYVHPSQTITEQIRNIESEIGVAEAQIIRHTATKEDIGKYLVTIGVRNQEKVISDSIERHADTISDPERYAKKTGDSLDAVHLLDREAYEEAVSFVAGERFNSLPGRLRFLRTKNPGSWSGIKETAGILASTAFAQWQDAETVQETQIDRKAQRTLARLGIQQLFESGVDLEGSDFQKELKAFLRQQRAQGTHRTEVSEGLRSSVRTAISSGNYQRNIPEAAQLTRIHREALDAITNVFQDQTALPADTTEELKQLEPQKEDRV